MGWFSKKEQVIDFTPLKNKVKIEDDVKDFTKQADDSGLGFLGVMANNADSARTEDIHVKDVKVKLDDFQYKLDSFSKRISSLMDRIDLLEKKVDRNNRLAG